MTTDINGMSLTALRKEAARLADLILDTKRKVQGLPEVLGALKAMNAAVKEYRETVDRKEVESVSPLQETLIKVKERIDQIEAEREAPPPPGHIRKVWDMFKAGTDFGPKPFRLLWVSPTGRFFIMTIPGHCFWASMMEPNKYAPSSHYLKDCAKMPPWNGDKREGFRHGFDVFYNSTARHIDGRLSTATKEEWMRIALDAEAKEPNAFDLGKLDSQEKGGQGKP